MKKLKAYGWGFFKGLILLFNIGVLIVLTEKYFNDSTGFAKLVITVVAGISGIITVRYFAKKHHQPHGWITLASVFTILVLPFLFGAIECEKEFPTNG